MTFHVEGLLLRMYGSDYSGGTSKRNKRKTLFR